MEFSHIGLVSDLKREGEVLVNETRVWITDFTQHPFCVEWLRYESDSPVTGPLRTEPHIAFQVDSITEAAAGMTVLLEPFTPLPGVQVGFYETEDGVIVEFIEDNREPSDNSRQE